MTVIELKTDDDFRANINRDDQDLVVVDFSVTWCGPCKRIAPVFEELSEEYSDSYFYKCDTADLDEVVVEMNISAVPTFICFREGKEVDRLAGANETKLRELLKGASLSPF